jgi:hypothetical protein
MARTHWNALRDPRIPLDAKIQVGVTCPDALFMETTTGPPGHEKVHRHFTPRMHRNALYDTHISPDAKNKFDVTCPSLHFMETTSGPPDHEK